MSWRARLSGGSIYGRDANACKILVRKSEKKRSLSRPGL
jgi:hypothetical protein